MNSSVDYENRVLDAIETIVNNKVENAGYDKTIQAIIIDNTEASIGKYRIKYQDSEWEAYSNNTNIIYSIGAMVNILIPGNDFNSTKTIIDAVDKKDIQYNISLEESDNYIRNGGNTIAANQEFGLCSYKENGDKIILYKDGVNEINFNAIEFNNNIKESDSILCAAEFKTNLAQDQQTPGNYGITFVIEFKDNFLGDIITKNFTIDINSMIGNPYEQKIFTNQYKIFDINNEDFVGVKEIFIFAENFPNVITEGDLINDIFVQNFQLYATSKLTTDELNNYNLSIEKPEKTYFDKNDNDTATIKMVSNLRYKNKKISDGVDYYWFKEDNNINMSSIDYNKFGGDGWACINNYNIIGRQAQIKEFIPTINTMLIGKTDVIGHILRIKCVAVKNEVNIAEKIISIYNYDSEIEIKITSDQGTLFFADDGNPTLTCETNIEEGLYYKWCVIDYNNTRINLNETTLENNEYNQALNDYGTINSNIKNKEAYPEASQKALEECSATLKRYEYIQRVEGNQIHKVNLQQIKKYSTFYCSVYTLANELVGTAQITIENRKIIDEGLYKLNIVNGDQTFIYNPMGVAPINNSLEKTLDIQPLTFEIVDKLGRKVEERVLLNCEKEWIIPNNSLISAVDLSNINLDYTIAEQYDYLKINNNTVKLRVKYKNLTLEAQTSFNFIKEGEPGTNGSDIICKIVPNTDEEFNEYPMIVNRVLNYTPSVENKWFKIQIWKTGTKIWEGYSDDNLNQVKVKWNILKNKYSASSEDTSVISIDNNGNFSSAAAATDNAANIVQAEIEYKGLKCYCTIPIITATIENINIFKAKLVVGTGFRYVIYTSDGRQPQYDNLHPFTIETRKYIDGYWEKTEDLKTENQVIYKWYVQSNQNQRNFIEVDDTNGTYQKFFTPVDEYDGECVTNSIKVEFYTGQSKLGTMYIPVHFYLNRHGIAALNDWNGNSISLNEDLGAILAPQVGAGKKDPQTNTFTGVLMGSVKESSSQNIEEGLFGYYNGERTIFLDANTGKAEFGKAGAAKIVLDPTSNKAQLYSGNYVAGTSGMMIDLTTPEIKFGSGNFSVSQYGNLTAKGGGSIAGWNISNTTLSKNTVGMCSDNSVDTNIAFWAGNSTLTSAPFRVNYKGELTATKATIQGTITATGDSTINQGTVGGFTSSSSGLSSNDVILSSTGYNGTVTINSSTSSNGPWAIYSKGNFGVTTGGTLWAKNGKFGGQIEADSGHIAGYTIDGDTLYGATVGMDATSGGHYAFWAGADKDNTGTAPFRVSHDGYITATRATITGAISATSGSFGNGQNKIIIGGIYTSDTHCNIHSGQKNTLNATTNGFYIGTDGISLGAYDSTLSSNPFQVTTAGALTARSGKIGGYTIDEWRLYGSKVGMCAEPDHTDWAFWAGAAQGSSASAPFRVGHAGELYSSNITVTGGSLKIGSRFEVNSSGRLVAKTSGGGQLSMGQFSNHPYVSGLNVGTFGIDMNSSGISKCTGLTNSGNLNFGSDGRLDIYGNTMYLRAKAGLGSMVFLTGSGGSGFTGLDLYNLVNGSSSIKMKTNIQQLSINDIYKLYDTVLNMPVYSYYYKKQYNDPTILHHGFIIEDIENSEINNYLHFKQDDCDNNIKIFNNNELPKMNLILIKALQNKIKELEEIIKKEGK